jgi:hypothetical protein
MPKKLSENIVTTRLDIKKIKLISNFKNVYTYSTVQCLVCNNMWECKLQDIFNGHGCAKCANIKNGERCKLSLNDIKTRLLNKNIEILSEYKNIFEIMKFKCNLCNNIITKNFHDFEKIKFKCYTCEKNPNHKPNNYEIDEKIKNRNILRIGDYITAHTPITWKCLNCNDFFISKPNSVISGNQGCPSCKIGKKEKHVKNLIHSFVKYDIFKHHYTLYFNNRRYIVDFFIQIKDKKIIIEYNGRQHYMPVRFIGMPESQKYEAFQKQTMRDNQLREYCKNNNIILLEIPYYWKDTKIIENLNIINDLNRHIMT